MWLRKQDHPICWGCHDPICNWLRQSVIRMIFVAASLSQRVALAAMLRNATSNSQKGCRRAEYQICIIAFGILVFLYFCIFVYCFVFLLFLFFNLPIFVVSNRREAESSTKVSHEILSLKVSALLQINCATSQGAWHLQWKKDIKQFWQ